MLKNRVNGTITLKYLKSVSLANMHDTEQRKETCIRQCAHQHTMSRWVQLVSSKLVILEMWDEKGEGVLASYVSCVCVCVCTCACVATCTHITPGTFLEDAVEDVEASNVERRCCMLLGATKRGEPLVTTTWGVPGLNTSTGEWSGVKTGERYCDIQFITIN